MTEKFNLSAEWAKNFGLYLEEATLCWFFPLKINLIVTHQKTAGVRKCA
ncbi:MAG: hypothetical protein ACLT8V_01105 [Streptococcus salivarius]